MEPTKSVLVCEDDPVQLQILSAMIRQAGYRSLSARTPVEAVAAARRCGIDAVVADVQLQDGNAFDLLGDLRQMGLDAPVFMASAYATEGVKKRARAAGVRDFFEKPFSYSRIKSGVDAAIKDSRRLEATVLLLESDATLRAAFKKSIEAAGFRALAVRDAAKVTRLLQSSGGTIEILVMDLHANGPSGTGLIRRALEIDPALRVVATSGDAGRPEIREAYEAGAASYLCKPIAQGWFGEFLKNSLRAARAARKEEEDRRTRRERRGDEPFLRKGFRWINSCVHAPSGSRRGEVLRNLALGALALALGGILALALQRASDAQAEAEAFTLRMLERVPAPGAAHPSRREASLGVELAGEQLHLQRESNDFTRRYYTDYLQELRWQGLAPVAPAASVPAAATAGAGDLRMDSGFRRAAAGGLR